MNKKNALTLAVTGALASLALLRVLHLILGWRPVLLVPASVLERDVLSSRVEEPGPMLDRLLLEGDPVANVSTLRVLRAVENSGDGASVSDVAEYMAVEHSTASRTVTRFSERSRASRIVMVR